MKNIVRHFVVLTLLGLISIGTADAQKKKASRLKVDYIKTFDGTAKLVSALVVREERYEPLAKVDIEFYSINDTSRLLVGKIKTNASGIAEFLLEDNPKVVCDAAGEYNFEVEYAGTSDIASAKTSISFQKTQMNLSFYKKDDVKLIEAELLALNAENQPSAVENLSLDFFVKGTFSLYNFGKQKTDEFGKAQIEFPVDMPGDTAGVLTIVVKVEDSKNFGTVESRGDINWGVVVPPTKPVQRGLGDTDAPLWMVYTLIILLSAVWFHYFYVIFMIIKIKLSR